PAGEACRAEIDRTLPGRPLIARADDDLRGAAADVADADALGQVVEAGERATVGVRRLLVGREHADRRAASRGEGFDQRVRVRLLAAGRRDDDLDPRAAEPPGG